MNFDNNQSTQVCSAVKNILANDVSMAPCHVVCSDEESSLESLEEALQALSLKDILSEKRYALYFSSWQEAIEALFFAFALNEIEETGKNHILLLETESAPIFYAAEKLKSLGCQIDTVSINAQGMLCLESLKQKITPRTSFLSLSFADSLLGVIQPIDRILPICKENGIKIHVDVSTSLGKALLPQNCDFITYNGQLVHSISGGCISFKSQDFFSQNDATLRPLCFQDPLGAKALAEAVRQSALFFEKMTLDCARLKKTFINKITAELPDAQVLSLSHCLPNVCVIFFPQIHGEYLAYLLASKGLRCGLGGGITQTLSSTIEKFNISKSLINNGLSFSLSRYTSKEDIESATQLIIDTAQQKLIFTKEI